jgi:hypothetical protein
LVVATSFVVMPEPKPVKGALTMNHIRTSALFDPCIAPHSSCEYDDGNPGTIVSAGYQAVCAKPVFQDGPHATKPALQTIRPGRADYDDGNPGTVLV